VQGIISLYIVNIRSSLRFRVNLVKNRRLDSSENIFGNFITVRGWVVLGLLDDFLHKAGYRLGGDFEFSLTFFLAEVLIGSHKYLPFGVAVVGRSDVLLVAEISVKGHGLILPLRLH